ncbi:MAG: MraY family glycosyltransferase [Planctomycetota bacterium]|nr:MraY family glycosyltransferase [Planctomycetota bacterium]
MSPFIAIPIVACVAALLLTPMTSRLALSKGWVDRPDARKVHRAPVAYLGGAAVMGALLVGFSAFYWLPTVDSSIRESLDLRLMAIVAGCALMFVVGLFDDLRDLKATSKLMAQLVAGGLVVAAGVQIDGFPITESIRLEFGIFGALITVFWIVGVTNAINIIDGLDGLASGISVVASGAISWTAFQSGNDAAGILMLTLMGAILGFLPYNLHPAKVFLGDAGSLTIGFALASTSALTATKASTAVGLLVPLVGLGIPILDTLFAMVRRTIERRSLLSADKSHLHHRLMALGFGQPKTVLLLCTIAALGVIATTAAAPGDNLARLGIAAAALLAFILVFRITGAIRFRESLAAVGGMAQNARVVADERQVVDAASLALGTARTPEEWWAALSKAAHDLDFDLIEIESEALLGERQPRRRAPAPRALLDSSSRVDDISLEPDDPHHPGARHATFSFSATLHEDFPPAQITLAMDDASSIESVARRFRLFCRVVERHLPRDIIQRRKRRGAGEQARTGRPASA